MSENYGGAKEYGSALFMLTEELGTTEAVRADVDEAILALEANPEYVKMLDTPALTPSERLALIDEAFASLDENLVNTLKLLAKGRMAHAIVKALYAYLDEYMESRGIIKAEVISAVALSEAQCDRLKEKLVKITGKTVVIDNKVDPTILGGIKLRYMGIQSDGSIRTRLEGFKAALEGTVIR